MTAHGEAPRERVAVLVNPRATRSGPALRRHLAGALAGHPVEWALTTRTPADAAAMALRVAAEGATLVVTLGGDGTAADVAGALADTAVTLAPVPGGNANVFSRAMGWPARPDRAVDLLGAALAARSARAVRMGLVTAGDAPPRAFIVNCGVGLDAATVEWIERRPRTKRRLRHAGFAVGLAVAAARARARPAPLLLEPDGLPALEAATVLAACGSPYTYLHTRPLDLVPGADFAGALRWAALRRVRLGGLSRTMLACARGRPPADEKAVAVGPVGAGLRITAGEPVPVQADGEALGRHAQVLIGPGAALSVLVPPPG